MSSDMSFPAEDNLGNPKVSIIIPSLNSISYYQECIDSALNQDLHEIEVICVDAGSTDGTRELIEERMESDPRVHLLHSDVRSYGYQMNLGMKHADGEYLMILESDDYLCPNACSTYWHVAHDNDLDFVKGDHKTFVGEGAKRSFTHMPLAMHAARYNTLCNPSEDVELLRLVMLTQPGIYRLSFLRDNRIQWNETPGAAYQDNGFLFQTFSLARRVMFIHDAMYMLRRDNPNSSITSSEKVYAECIEFDFIRDWLKQRELYNFLPMCAYRRSLNYMATVRRICDWHRPAFFERFATDFRELENAGELDRRLFPPLEWESLRQVMREGSSYYHATWLVQERLRQEEHKTRQYQQQYQEKVQSASYRLGHALIEPVRMAKRLVRRKHPIPHTGGRINRPKIENPFSGAYYQYCASLGNVEFEQQLETLVARSYVRKRKTEFILARVESFNEKVQARKIYDPNRELTALVCDAWGSRAWAASRIGWDCIPTAWGPWKSFDEIDFDVLPDSFVLRCSHCPDLSLEVKDRDAFSHDAVQHQIELWLSGNFAYTEDHRTELRDIEPLVFAEELLTVDEEAYSLWCFGGEVQLIQPVGKSALYSAEWKLKPYSCGVPDQKEADTRPGNLAELVHVATSVADGLDFVMVTMGVCKNGRVLLRGLSVSPYAGFVNWRPASADFWVGDLWESFRPQGTREQKD